MKHQVMYAMYPWIGQFLCQSCPYIPSLGVC
jgi:hypothetical protein